MNSQPIVDHFVGGNLFVGASSRMAPVYDPALGTVSKQVRLASTGDVSDAVAVAQAAFPAWRRLWARPRKRRNPRPRPISLASERERASQA